MVMRNVTFKIKAESTNLSDHEACNVLEEKNRSFALAAQLYEVRTFERRLAEQNTVVCNDPHRNAVDVSEPCNQGGAVLLFKL